MDRADPPKRRFRWRILLGMALVGALVLALTVDFGKLRRTLTMLTSIELGQDHNIAPIMMLEGHSRSA